MKVVRLPVREPHIRYVHYGTSRHARLLIALSVHADSHIHHLSRSNPTLLNTLTCSAIDSPFGPRRSSHSPFVKVKSDTAEITTMKVVRLPVREPHIRYVHYETSRHARLLIALSVHADPHIHHLSRSNPTLLK